MIDVGPASRASRRTSATTSGMPVRSQSTRFMLTWAIGGMPILEKDAHRLHGRHPAGASRMVFAILMATPISSVRRLTLAMSGLRAPTATAPPRG